MHAETRAPLIEARPEQVIREDFGDLMALAPEELGRLYSAAKVPVLEDVSGDLKGRMLSWAIAPSYVNRALRAFASSSLFPWRGKSFKPRNAAAGEGKNRVFSDRIRWFRFETFVAKSRAGNFDAVQLDYDLPENPGIIRAIKDEIREIAPGHYLGQAYMMVKGQTHLVLYFELRK